MKKLLFAILLATGTTAFANTIGDNVNPTEQEKKTAVKKIAAVTQDAAEATQSLRPVKADPPVTAKQAQGRHASIAESMADGSRFGIGAYIVDFINRHNIKLVRRILTED